MTLGLLASLRAHRLPVCCLCKLSGHSATLISGDLEGNLILWDTKLRRRVSQISLNAHILAVGEASSNLVFVQTRNGLVVFISICASETGELELSMMQNDFSPIKFNPLNFFRASLGHSGKYILLPDHECKLFRIVDFKSGVILGELGSSENGLLMTAFACNKNATGNSFVVYAGYEDGSVIAWTVVETNNEPNNLCLTCVDSELIHFFSHPVIASACIENGNESIRMAFGSAEGNLVMIDSLKNRKRLVKLPSGISSISLHPTEPISAVGCWDGSVAIIPFGEGIKSQILKEHRDAISDVLWMPTNRNCHLVSASQDSRITLWTDSESMEPGGFRKLGY